MNPAIQFAAAVVVAGVAPVVFLMWPVAAKLLPTSLGVNDGSIFIDTRYYLLTVARAFLLALLAVTTTLIFGEKNGFFVPVLAVFLAGGGFVWWKNRGLKYFRVSDEMWSRFFFWVAAAAVIGLLAPWAVLL